MTNILFKKKYNVIENEQYTTVKPAKTEHHWNQLLRSA
jgi:hypothetical protein